jgi:hypothetical protein
MDYMKKINHDEVFDTNTSDEQDRISLIKHKYIMYLEWLNRNRSNRTASSKQNKNQIKENQKLLPNSSNLNWYKYESSLTATSVDDRTSSYSKTSIAEITNHQYKQLPQITLGKPVTNKRYLIKTAKREPITVPESTQIFITPNDHAKRDKRSTNYSLSKRLYSSKPTATGANNQRGVKFELQTGTDSASLNKNEQQTLRPILKRNLNSATPGYTEKLKIIPTSTPTVSITPTILIIPEQHTLMPKQQMKHAARLPLLSDTMKNKSVAGYSDDFYAVVNDLECNHLV